MDSEQIYLVITQDRHIDIEAIAFKNKDKALAYAKNESEMMSNDNFNVYTSFDKEEDCYYFCYSCEGDTMTVKPGLLML
jgi:hypothetical protein